jgi:hypothetical protein
MYARIAAPSLAAEIFLKLSTGNQARPALLTGVLARAVAASAGVSRVRVSLIWRSRAVIPDLLGQDAGEKVGEGWSFLFGPLWSQNLDQMRNLARQGFELALEGLAVFKKSVLGVIHLVEEFAGADEIVGDSAEVRVIGGVAEGHEDDPFVGQGGLASLAKRLVKLARHFVLSGTRA